ncbi:MAG: hypothetical protein U9P12_02085 [Verrucomicrobiota bacterium]|nr:hypothetical protein [Verrucomicrobiota bacterium]
MRTESELGRWDRKNMTTSINPKIPQQLIDVLDDVLAINAPSFRLTREAEHIMVAFSTLNRAGEIDYTMESGEEMMTYLIEQGYSHGKSPHAFFLEFEKTKLKCQLTVDNLKRPNLLEICFTKE